MRYKNYKKVDIPWINEVPSHWEIARNKNLFKHKKNIVGDEGESVQLLSLTTRGIKKINIEDSKGKTPMSYNTYQMISKNDLVLCLFDLDVSAVFSDVSKYCGMISPAYQVFESDIVYMNYYKYIFDKIFQDRSYKLHSKSLRYTITPDNFLMLDMIVPPKEEQEQIARFLDWKINEIDRLILDSISKQNYLLNIWEKILNSYLEEGEEIALKYLVYSNSRSLSDKDVIDTIKYIEISDVGYGFLKSSPKTIELKDAPSRARRLVNTDNIIISTVRTYLKSIYKIKESEKDCVVSTGFSVLEAKNDANTDYLYLKLSTQKFLDEVQRNSIGISYPAISDSKLLSLKISFEKDLNKQNIIADKLINIKKKVRDLLDLENKKINNLKQLKQSIISDVVTGKIDVRNIEIPKYKKDENIDINYDKEEIEEEV